MTPKILIADDDEEIQAIIREAAAPYQFELVQVLDGQEALERVRQEKPDLVLLDVMMPGMDGRDVLQRMKRDPATAQIPVLMISARSDQPDRHLGLDLGAEDYIEKPFDVGALLRKVNYLLKKRMKDKG